MSVLGPAEVGWIGGGISDNQIVKLIRPVGRGCNQNSYTLPFFLALAGWTHHRTISRFSAKPDTDHVKEAL